VGTAALRRPVERVSCALAKGLQFEPFPEISGWKSVAACGTLRGVNKPELLITSSPEDEILSGNCSSCRAVQFRIRGNNLRNQELMRGMFDKHFKRVHMRNDPSQNATPIVKETDD
jgi:hypothetical protein